MTEKITKEINIMELADLYPEAARVLMESGMHCLGCVAARFETLEEGLKAHGKTEQEIEEILKKMNEVIEK